MSCFCSWFKSRTLTNPVGVWNWGSIGPA